jgi:formate-dependent nitrite reductase cytochrome c552 subunit
MRAARQRVVSTVVLLAGSLPLVMAASCSLQKRVVHESGGKETKEVFVANAFCSACHYGFADENLARTHEQAGIGCERCHGESERHRSDENNVTPPDIMYPRDKINPTCMMCHPRQEIRRVAAHKALLAGAKTALDPASKSDDREMVCTDCHAKEHHIKVRTIRWNKATGERLNR